MEHGPKGRRASRCWCCRAWPPATPARRSCDDSCARAATPLRAGDRGSISGSERAFSSGRTKSCASSTWNNGRTVSVIGWSLGGLYARELAKHSPEMVRLCISMGSPFTGHPRETNAWRLYEFASGHRIDWHDFHGPLRAAPPVPTTSIWSPTDGVVAWRCSVETRRILAENIVVDSSHLGLGAHPAALYAIADRLAQPEGQWEPFHRDGWRRFVYGDPKQQARREGAPSQPAAPRAQRSRSPDPRLGATCNALAASSCRPCRPTSAAAPQRRSRSPGSRSWR